MKTAITPKVAPRAHSRARVATLLLSSKANPRRRPSKCSANGDKEASPSDDYANTETDRSQDDEPYYTRYSHGFLPLVLLPHP